MFQAQLNVLYTLLKRFYFPELGGVGQEAFEFTSNFGNNRVDSDMYKCTYYKSATTCLKNII